MRWRITAKLAFRADLAGSTGERVTNTGDHRVEADTRRRVVTQLITQLTADAVADAGFVGGEIEFGHAGLRSGKKGRPD